MIHMLCRNKVADFAKWKQVFDSHAEAHIQAGLTLENVWRSVDDANNVFFMFEVDDIGTAKAFINAPGAEEVGRASGVIDGEYDFVKDSSNY